MKTKYFTIQEQTTEDDLKRQQKELQMKYHPDRNLGNTEECTRISAEINKDFQEVIETLTLRKELMKISVSGMDFCSRFIDVLAEMFITRSKVFNPEQVRTFAKRSKLILVLIDTDKYMEKILEFIINSRKK